MSLPAEIHQGTADGRLRNLRALTEADFNIEDIATRLSMINRFCGQTRFPLSVATHSVVVSYLAPKGLELTGLLHDITESFGIGDVISPVKHINAAFKELEADILQQLANGPFPSLLLIDQIEHADKRATAIEAMVHRGSFPEWAVKMGVAGELTDFEQQLTDAYYMWSYDWTATRDLFLRRYYELSDLGK